MLKPLLALIAAAALPAAALSQATTKAGEWNVSGSPGGCIAYTSLPQGTVVSVMAGREQEKLLFLIQNKQWSSLRDGSRYELAVQLDGQNQWQFEAVAKTELDADGPGLMFEVSPADQNGAKFISAFAGATGMNVGENGRALASLRLSGGGSAMTELAQCMSQMWSGGGATQVDDEVRGALRSGSGKAIRL